MAGQVAELEILSKRDGLADAIVSMYITFKEQRRLKESEWKELRNYIFATDTTKTTNSQLPWKNKTTLPKLCQIRDNLHANYMAALFPNDNWMKWEGYTEEDEEQSKKQAIEAYIYNKLRESNFRQTISDLVYDYIDYGNAFAEVEYVAKSITIDATGEEVSSYTGPRLKRVSPLDIIFNPIASSFEDSPKITRYIKSIGEIKKEAKDKPSLAYLQDVINEIDDVRATVGRFDSADIDKANGFFVDGFGSLQEYYQSDYVELIEFEGSLHDPDTGEFLENHIITIVDRRKVLRSVKNPSWLGKDNKVHVGWRKRPDNLYSMGPLDNLVGMQYRIDHLENIKADLFDLIAHPPLKIKGNVEEFEWGPLAEIYMGDDGEVDILKVDATALQADTQIAILEQKMEDYAGAPKQAMGVRTPGEKTAYEVQQLENAAGRIFQQKAVNFEISLIEPILNMMLELSKRYMDGMDIIRVMDDDIAVADFLNVTKEDITAKGKLRPLGARHFAATAQLVQNLSSGLQIAGIVPGVLSHVSSKKLAKLLFEEVAGLERFDLVQDNIAIMEQAETQRLMNQASEDVEVEATTSIEGSEEEEIDMEEPTEGEPLPEEGLE